MVGTVRKSRSRRASLAVMLLGGALAVAGLAEPSGAAPVTFDEVSCSAVVTLVGGGTLNQTQAVDVTVEVSAPAEAETATAFTITLPGGSTDLPTTALNGALKIVEYSNLSTTYQIVGASIVAGSLTATGVPTINGTPITGTADIIGTDKVKIGTPGPIPTGTLARPTVSFQVLAGSVGDIITVKAVELTTATKLTTAADAPFGDAAVTCAVPQTVLATTTVVAPPPPPPGAPDAVNDNVTTAKDTSVLIDVTANDTKNPQFDIDPASLAVTTAPTKGTAVVEDGQIRYTPNSGAVGPDSFRYELCSVGDGESPGACDSALVSVTITDPTVVQATTTTTTAPVVPDTTTTAAPAAPAQLPRTGGSTVPLAAMGVTILLAGFALVLRSRKGCSPRELTNRPQT